MRSFLVLTLLLIVGCEKATPRSTADKPYEAERIRTLTHDEDLKHRPASAGDLRSVGEALKTEAPPATRP